MPKDVLGRKKSKARSKLSSSTSERTGAACAVIWRYTLSTTRRNLVYDVPVFELWNVIASASVHCPRIDAAMVLAADSAFEKAKWTPEEKNGSICAQGERCKL